MGAGAAPRSRPRERPAAAVSNLPRAALPSPSPNPSARDQPCCAPQPPLPPADLSEQLRATRAHNHALQQEVEALAGSVRRLKADLEDAASAAAARARGPFAAAAGAWQAASFLLLFLVVINIAG